MKSILVSLLLAISLASSAVAQTLNINRIIADIISFQGDGDVAYTIQTSVNLTNWSDLVILNGTSNGYHSFTNFPTQSHLFYRTVGVNQGFTNFVIVGLDPSSPMTSTVQISTTVETLNVVLAVYNVKIKDVPGTLQKLQVNLNSTGVTNISRLLTNVKIKQGSTLFGSVSPSNVVVFKNLGISLPADTWVPITIVADIAGDTDGTLEGATVSTTIVTSGYSGGQSNNPSVVDSNFTTVEVANSTVSSSTITFTDGALMLGQLSTVRNIPVFNSQNGDVSYPIALTFTVIAGNNIVFISNNATNAVSTTFINNGLWQWSFYISASSGTVAGDGVSWFVVPAGSARTFTIAGIVKGNLSDPSIWTASITAIKFGATSSTLTSFSITNNLETLRITGPY